MSDDVKNTEERIVENEETKMGVTSPFPPNYVHMKTDYTLPTIGKKREWWQRAGFLRRIIEVAPGVLFIAEVVVLSVALLMLIIMRKMEYTNLIFTFMIGIGGLIFISAGVSIIVKREITTGFSDQPIKAYFGKEAINTGQFLIGWGILILIVGYFLLWLGFFVF